MYSLETTGYIHKNKEINDNASKASDNKGKRVSKPCRIHQKILYARSKATNELWGPF